MNRVLMSSAIAGAGVMLGGAQSIIPSTPDLGKAEGRCRTGEAGPAFLVDIAGLKDRAGTLKLEVYPANDADFLQDDNILVSQGKAFSRVEGPVPAAETPHLCVRVPRAGLYGVVVLHDRNGNRRFNWTVDGIGFSGNPRLGPSKPRASRVAVQAGNGLTPVRVVMNYRNGLLSVGPIDQK